MGWWIFWLVVGALIVWMFISSVKQQQANAVRIEENRIASEKRKVEFALAKAKFWADNFKNLEVHDCRFDGSPAFMMLKGKAIRLVSIANQYIWDVKTDQTIKLSELRSVEFVHDDKIETYHRKVTTPVAVAKNKSAIGRGAAGMVLLGPVGLALGAASAMTPKTQIVEHTTTVMDQRVVKGPPMLVLTTKARTDPFIRLEFAKADDAKAWALYLSDQLAA